MLLKGIEKGALGKPMGAASLVKRRLKARELTLNQAAKEIGVNQSTLSRFLAGGSLTVNLAAKLAVLEIDARTLFNLEAERLSYEVEQLLK